MMLESEKEQPPVVATSIWESKAWVVIERIVGLIIFAALAFGVWNTLLRIEKKQAEDSSQQSKDINETQELIKAGMTEEEWQRATESLNSLKHNSTP